MTDAQIIKFLEGAGKNQPGLSEVARKISFQGTRVTVDIFDRGEHAGELRYSVVATSNGGRPVTGNPHPKLETALSGVHWSELDKPTGR